MVNFTLPSTTSEMISISTSQTFRSRWKVTPQGVNRGGRGEGVILNVEIRPICNHFFTYRAFTVNTCEMANLWFQQGGGGGGCQFSTLKFYPIYKDLIFLSWFKSLDWRNGLYLILTAEQRWKRWTLTQHITIYLTDYNLKVKNCPMPSL